MQEYTNSEVSELIDEYIHVERDRNILKARLINGFTYEMLAETFDISVTQVKRIVYKGQEQVFRHLNPF